MQDSMLSRGSIDIMSGSIDVVGASVGESSSDRMEVSDSGSSVVLQGNAKSSFNCTAVRYNAGFNIARNTSSPQSGESLCIYYNAG